jgi:hypothetical protein
MNATIDGSYVILHKQTNEGKNKEKSTQYSDYGYAHSPHNTSPKKITKEAFHTLMGRHNKHAISLLLLYENNEKQQQITRFTIFMMGR